MSFSELYDLSKSIGLINALKSKLMMQKDPAAAKLVTALSEIYKNFSFLDKTLNDYVSIWFNETDNINIERNRRILIGLLPGSIEIKMEDSKGSCYTIQNIYNRYLSPWFQRVLETKEYKLMEQLFRKFEEFDGIMVEGVKKVAQLLTAYSQEVMNLVTQNKFDEANELIEKNRFKLLPDHKNIVDAMKTLFSLKSEFIKISGAV
ncbi:MAG: hypothetical protein ACFFAT_21690 [Promethearchaeota archaeon]